MFVGRQRELSKLGELYTSGKFECAVVYGRRRVGKTTLINEFIKDKKAIYYTGLEMTSQENLSNFSKSIMSMQLGMDTDAIYPNFQAALDAVYNLAQDERIILVIDEYPYLAASYSGFSSLLQTQIDTKFKNSKLMLILCGSSMSFMETQVLGYKSPLYGRRTAQFKILPFDYFEMRAYYSRFTPTELAVIYGVTSGVPQYMEFMDDALSIEENIKRNFFDPSSFLFEEPTNLLKQEVREPAHYNAIIHAIAKGSSRNAEIASKVGITSSASTAYLKNLIALGIIKKETPITEPESRKTIYAIADSMFRFWYRFIPDNISLIQSGLADRLWAKVEPQIPAFMGFVFEDICKQWLWQQNIAGRLAVPFTKLGRWWGNDPVRKQETEIDILALTDENAAIFAECKWTNEKVDAGVLERLMERGELFRYGRKYYYVFSKNGFTKGCMDKAASVGATLVSFADMN